mmetsp:Transcript_39573/g.60484  ORF Transcript_39573/g.60484 Transcript_39573/m.60484 type:complete len:95 (+) Transcript_39573:144-428(+)
MGESEQLTFEQSRIADPVPVVQASAFGQPSIHVLPSEMSCISQVESKASRFESHPSTMTSKMQSKMIYGKYEEELYRKEFEKESRIERIKAVRN